jgi:hypothetical protein
MSKRGSNRTKRCLPAWTLVRRGKVVRLVMDPFGDGRPRRCLAVFYTHEDARSFISQDQWADGIRPCRIGFTGPQRNESATALASLIEAASVKGRCEYAALLATAVVGADTYWRLFDIRPGTLGLSPDQDLT